MSTATSSASVNASMYARIFDLKRMPDLAKTQFIYLNERPIILHRVIPYGQDAYTIHYSYMEDHPKLCNQITITNDGKTFMGRQYQYVFTTMITDAMYDIV
jgi:hypothetical protein